MTIYNSMNLPQSITSDGVYMLSDNIKVYDSLEVTYVDGTIDTCQKVNTTVVKFHPDDVTVTSEFPGHPYYLAVDDSASEWAANGEYGSTQGHYIQIAIDRVSKEHISSIMVYILSNLPSRNGHLVAVYGVADDDSIVEVGRFTTVSGQSFTIDVSDTDMTPYKAIRFTRIGGSGRYYAISNIYIAMDAAHDTYTSTTANSALRFYDNSVQVTNLTKEITAIGGMRDGYELYRLYRKGTDGTPALFMPEQTTIGSSLGTADLSTDLTTLASKEYVADEVDKFSRSSLAGKVDTYEDLPATPVESSLYTPGALTSNGVPYVDEYAVGGDDLYGDAYMPYMASSDTVNGYWHTSAAAFPKSYYMYFKSAIRLTSILMRNRTDSPDCSFYGYTVEGSNDNGTTWDVVYSGVNTNSTLTAYWTIDLSSNSKYYNTYRIKGTSSHFGNYLAQWLIQPSGYHIQYDASTHSRVGDIYLVGTDGALEEYIFTDSYQWERMGEIRQSDVDLSGYTTTEGMVPLIDASSDHMGTNIETMRTDIQSYLDTLEQEISGSMGELPLDGRFQNDVPTVWDSRLSDRAMLFVTEPDTVPYTAPELASDGVPGVDEYAVRASSVGNSLYSAYKATYSNGYTDHTWHGANSLPHYFYMTFKEPFNAKSMLLKNRFPTQGNHIYAPKEFHIEAKDTSGEWVLLHSDTNPSGVAAAEYTVEFNNSEFYTEYRLRITSTYPGLTAGTYVCIDLVRLSGNIRKS